jgi:hypothetical protein
MTSEERLDRIEHSLAGWIEQSKREHQENREFVRQISRELTDKLHQYADEGQAQLAAFRAEAAERDRIWHAELAERNRAWREEVGERDRKMDDRIGQLVGAITELIRK